MAAMMGTSKESRLKKLLIRNAAVAAVVLMVLGTGGILLSNYSDDTLADQSTRTAQNNMISSQYREIETTLGRQSEVAGYYDTYAKNHNSNFTINRETMTGMLASLRKTHHLTSLDVTISSIADVPQTSIALKSGHAVKSTVHIVLGALTDNAVYNFIYDLQHTLPGVVIISDLKITRTGALTRETALSAINQHTIIPLVTGDLSFTWVGIVQEENAASHANEHDRPPYAR
ncbi:MAG TPA: hypothetical protein VFT64_07360 [Rickettsiales bacterium]|nr:hypothetical protein [Rickettsiales bacterium]